VPLLAVLPGTGGLTRITDKRKVRRDLADVFCTTAEGGRADRAKAWKLVDHIAPPDAFKDLIAERGAALAKLSDRPDGAKGISLTPLERTIDDAGYHYKFVDVGLDYDKRTATLNVKAPEADGPDKASDIEALGAEWWPLRMARELDDAILLLRANNAELGTILLKTEGAAGPVLAAGKALARNLDNWFVRETANMLARTFARLDTSSRSLFAIVDRGSCFAGLLAELALAADRSYMLDDREEPEASPRITLDETNFGLFAMPNGVSRIDAHFQGDEPAIEAARKRIGEALSPEQALECGLVTFIHDDLDWQDEIRIAVEERTSLSPDALTGMEASLRFGGPETMATKVFGRLTAWQNWIFIRPNSVGETGALKLYGTGKKPGFNWERI